MTLQVVSGTALLIFCALIHVAAVAFSIPVFPRLRDMIQSEKRRRRTILLLSFSLFVVVSAHTVQVWAWAFVLYAANAFDTFATSFYFATVTYTTLGYGDLVLDDGLRIFGTFASITGLLTFGISTAFLIGLIVRMMPDSFDRLPSGAVRPLPDEIPQHDQADDLGGGNARD